MSKGSIFKKCLSLVMVIAVLASLAVPAFAATSTKHYDYVALGDATTAGWGLDEAAETDAYYVKVAEYLGTDNYAFKSAKRYRVEEIRYLLDTSYNGDAYTAAIHGIGAAKKSGEVKNYVTNTDKLSVMVGVNNFTTYIVEQMMSYLENNGKPKYAYDFDDLVLEGDENLLAAVENLQQVVLETLLDAAPDGEGDQAIELVNYTVEICTYALLSYVENFKGMVDAIYALNPDVELYIVGIYNPAAGETLSLTYEGKTYTFPIGTVIEAVIEFANLYTQVLLPRVYDYPYDHSYTYVNPGNPELLIDQMANTSLKQDDRIPDELVTQLLFMVEETVTSMVQEMFEPYGVTKTDKEAMEIAEEIANLPENERHGYIRDLINDEAAKLVIDELTENLKEYTGKFGTGEDPVTEEEVTALLEDLYNAKDEAAREERATEFVDGILTDPAILNQALTKGIYDYIQDYEGYDLQEYITVENVEDLLNKMQNAADTDAAREAVVKSWMNDLAVAKIVEKVKALGVEGYTAAKAEEMMAAMEKDPDNAEAIAKEHLQADGFHAFMVGKFEETYQENGLTLQTYKSFDKFVTAVENANDAEAEEIVRNEIKAAAVYKITQDEKYELISGSVTEDDITALFTSMDKASDKSACLSKWIADMGLTDIDKFLSGYVTNTFNSAYNAYDNAADVAVNAVLDYKAGVETAADAFAQYVRLEDEVIGEILRVYKDYVGEDGKLDLTSNEDFQKQKNNAVNAVLDGYEDYAEAIVKGEDAGDQLNDKLGKVYDLMCEIAEVDTISLNDLLSVSKKVVNNGKSYFEEMYNNLIQGDLEATEDKTVAYLALRYVLADAMMIMPSAKGHDAIASQLIKAMNGEDTSSLTGRATNKLIDAVIAYLKKPVTGSGQATTLVDPDLYVALGDNITNGAGLNGSDTYVDILGDYLAMNGEGDVVCNYALNGLRTEDLLAMLDEDYSGDAYTKNVKLSSLDEDYLDNIKSADLITVNVGINNLVTYPVTQTLLEYNGKDTYEMDWTRFYDEEDEQIADLFDKVGEAKDTLIDLVLRIVNVAENRVQELDGTSAYAKCEKMLDVLDTAVQSVIYGVLGYAVDLDNSVEALLELNPTATIVLVGFYNPLEDTYFKIDRPVTVGNLTHDLSKYPIDVDALSDKVINLANRFLTNYVGLLASDGTAANEGSRIVTVSTVDTTLCIDDCDVSKDLSTLTSWKTVSVKGKNITIKVPQYLVNVAQTHAHSLLPNAEGHKYIATQIRDALDYEITEPVIGTITGVKWTMSLDSVVYLDYFVEMNGFADDVDFATQGGVVIWTGDEAPTSSDQLYVGAENTVVLEGMYYDEENGWYVRTHEIYAKNLGDMVYLRPYVEVADGVYVYTEKGSRYSPALYCYDMLDNASEREDTRNVCAALLAYGAEAQKYFDYNTDALVTTAPDKYTHINLADYDLEFDEKYLDELVKIDNVQELADTLEGTKNGIEFVKATLDLQGAIRMPVGYNVDSGVINMNKVKSAQVLFWTASDIAKLKSLTVDNASYVGELMSADGSEEVDWCEYYTLSDHILAKNLGETVYFSCRIETTGGKVYRSGLVCYSPEQYLADQIKDAEDHVEVCKAIAVYSEMARIRFIDNAN